MSARIEEATVNVDRCEAAAKARGQTAGPRGSQGAQLDTEPRDLQSLQPVRSGSEAPPSSMALTASFVIGSAVVLFFGCLPAVLGGLKLQGLLDEASVGRIMTVEMLALAATATFGPRIMREGGRSIGIALIGLVAINLLSWQTASTAVLYASRLISGLLSGLAFCAAVSVQMRTRQPERTSAVFFAISAIPQIIVGYFVPAQVIPVWGAGAGFLILASAFALGLPFAPLMRVPAATFKRSTPTSRGWLRGSPVLVLIGAIILHNAGTGAGWTYAPLIGIERGFPPDTVGLAVGGSLAASLLGSVTFALLAWRLPSLSSLVVGLLVQAGVAVALAVLNSGPGYVMTFSCFGLLWMALLPFYVRPAVELDPSRQLATALFGIGLAGMALGPLVA